MSVGLNFGAMLQSGTQSITDKGAAMQAKMDEIMSKESASPEDMMALQFEMGQYTAFMEALSSTTKSITDMTKSLAQRTG